MSKHSVKKYTNISKEHVAIIYKKTNIVKYITLSIVFLSLWNFFTYSELIIWFAISYGIAKLISVFYYKLILLPKIRKLELQSENRQKDLLNQFSYIDIKKEFDKKNFLLPLYIKSIPNKKCVELITSEHYAYISSDLKTTEEKMKSIFINSKVSDLLPSYKENIIKEKEVLMLDLIKSIDDIVNSLHFYSFHKIIKEPYFKFIPMYLRDNNFYDSRNYYSGLCIQYIESITKELNELIKSSISAKKGTEGENRVFNHLNLYKDILYIEDNVRFYVEGQSVETDCLVICDKGIFALEVKNYGKDGELIKISKDGKWTRHFGKTVLPIKDVVEQNERHCAIKQRIINEALKQKGHNLPYIFVNSIIVIANDNVDIENQTNNVILRTSNIYNYIKNFNTDYTLSKEVQEEIINIIDQYRQPLLKYQVFKYEETILAYFSNLLSVVDGLIAMSKIDQIYNEVLYDLYSVKVLFNSRSGKYFLSEKN